MTNYFAIVQKVGGKDQSMVRTSTLFVLLPEYKYQCFIPENDTDFDRKQEYGHKEGNEMVRYNVLGMAKTEEKLNQLRNKKRLVKAPRRSLSLPSEPFSLFTEVLLQKKHTKNDPIPKKHKDKADKTNQQDLLRKLQKETMKGKTERDPQKDDLKKNTKPSKSMSGKTDDLKKNGQQSKSMSGKGTIQSTMKVSVMEVSDEEAVYQLVNSDSTEQLNPSANTVESPIVVKKSLEDPISTELSETDPFLSPDVKKVSVGASDVMDSSKSITAVSQGDSLPKVVKVVSEVPSMMPSTPTELPIGVDVQKIENKCAGFSSLKKKNKELEERNSELRHDKAELQAAVQSLTASLSKLNVGSTNSACGGHEKTVDFAKWLKTTNKVVEFEVGVDIEIPDGEVYVGNSILLNKADLLKVEVFPQVTRKVQELCILYWGQNVHKYSPSGTTAQGPVTKIPGIILKSMTSLLSKMDQGDNSKEITQAYVRRLLGHETSNARVRVAESDKKEGEPVRLTGKPKPRKYPKEKNEVSRKRKVSSSSDTDTDTDTKQKKSKKDDDSSKTTENAKAMNSVESSSESEEDES